MMDKLYIAPVAFFMLCLGVFLFLGIWDYWELWLLNIAGTATLVWVISMCNKILEGYKWKLKIQH